MIKPYVGITGFMNRHQVQAVLDGLDAIGFPDSHRLMVGVLVSPKSLRGEPLKPIWQNKYPDPDQLATIFVAASRALNLVHFNTKEPNLARQLELIVDMTPNLDGFQLNISWPDPAELRLFREQYPDLLIVLQVGPRILQDLAIGTDPWLKLHDRLKVYVGLIEYVLFDGSGGVGIELDVDNLKDIILGLSIFSDMRFMDVIAGGLEGAALEHLVQPILEISPSLSWDAEGRLRTYDALDFGKCLEYLQASSELLCSQAEQHLQRWGKQPTYGY